MPVAPNQEDQPSESVTKSTFAVLSFMASAIGMMNAAPPELRCMGRRCPREAEYAVTAIDPKMGAHEHPIKLCRVCLTRLGPSGEPVDLFRWLSDNRIEADR